MREIGKEPPVGREIAAAGKDAAAELCAGFVTQTCKIPLSNMRPIRRSTSKDGHDWCLCSRDAIDPWRYRIGHFILYFSGASSIARSFQPRAAAKSATVISAKPGAPMPRSVRSAPA